VLIALAESDAHIGMSAIAWFEFCRGPRTPEQLAIARTFFDEDGIVPFGADLAEQSAERFRQLGSPRARAADIAIATTAITCSASLATHNVGDFVGIDGLCLYSPP
jgi:predicted nucleic acid-binding protein